MKYWYNPNPCFGKPISQSHSLSHPHRQPNPLPSLLWRAPGWRLAGLRPNITTRPLCPPSMQQNRNSRPCFSLIGPWFVRLLTMAAHWVTCYVGNIWARFLAPLADGSRGSLHNTEQHFRNIRNDPMLWWGKQQKVCTGKVLTKWSCDPWDTVESNQPPPKTDISLPSSAATETTLRPNIPFDHFWDNNSYRPSHVCYNVLIN